MIFNIKIRKIKWWNIIFILVGMLLFLYAAISYVCYVPKNVRNDNDFVVSIENKRAFDDYAAEPLLNAYGNIKAVKVAYEFDKKRLFFINGKKYNLHYTFCKKVLQFKGNSPLFNVLNYSETPLRVFALANLNYFPEQDVYAIEFVSEDHLTVQQMNEVITCVRESIPVKAKLKLFINNDYLHGLASQMQLGIITPQEVFGSASFQSIQQGRVIGKLRYVRSKSDMRMVNKQDVLVVQGSPVYIPNCAAVISDVFQTPLSHIQIMTKGRRMPSLAYKNIFEEEYKTLNGRWVELVVRADTFILRKTDMRNSIVDKEKVSSVRLQSDNDFNEILPINELDYSSKNRVGNKAAGLAFLVGLGDVDFKTPERAFAIPFFYYHEHLEKTQVNVMVQNLSGLPPNKITQQLKKIRKEIRATPISEKLIDNLENKIGQSDFKRFRFRSSANAEDMPGYSGAGLYKSRTAMFGTDKTVQKAIQNVWASAWTWKAYQERKNAGISDQDFSMGILVHRAFPDEDANGVLISTNIYNDDLIGYTVNVQKGDLSVVQPKDSVLCDQLIIFESSDFSKLRRRIASQYITMGNQNNGHAVLSKKQQVELYQAAKFVHEHFLNDTEKQSVDIEFKIDKGQLYFKQVRRFR